MVDKTTDTLRGGIFCVLIFLACFWLAWPVANMGFLDDWSYIKTAEVFAQTGQMVYNGWASPILGWMIPWGALFIKLFGFSFMTVKLSTLPVAVATLLLFHGVLRRFEIGPGNAVIGTLTLGLSPLFLPLSASFMTDIPGLFAIVLCLYLCQRALAAGSDRAAIAWLAAAAVSDVVGGTARQVAWLGVLVMVPCTGWVLRKRRKVLAAALALWLAGTGVVFYCMHWFAQQPYSVPISPLPRMPRSVLTGISEFFMILVLLGSNFVFLLVLVFPLLAAGLLEFGRKRSHYVALLFFGVLPLLFMTGVMHDHDVWPRGLLLRYVSIWRLHRSPTVVPKVVRVVCSLGVIAAVVGLGSKIADKSVRKLPSNDFAGLQRLFWLVVPYFFSYFLLLAPLALKKMAFGRYMLGVFPFAIIGLLWFQERWFGARLPKLSYVAFFVYSLFTIASVHNVFARERACLAGIHELRAAGIPRAQIEGGYEYDGWTQVRRGGLINNIWMKPQPNTGGGASNSANAEAICRYWFLPYVPMVHPKYAVGYRPRGCYLPSRFPSEHYTSWLPPFRRPVEVRRIPGDGSEKHLREPERGDPRDR